MRESQVTEPEEAPPRGKYNPIFEMFVGKDAADEQNLTNLIAYSLYKKAKVQWTFRIKEDRKRPPTS